jgi:hypothetical protein
MDTVLGFFSIGVLQTVNAGIVFLFAIPEYVDGMLMFAWLFCCDSRIGIAMKTLINGLYTDVDALSVAQCQTLRLSQHNDMQLVLYPVSQSYKGERCPLLGGR